MLSTKEETASSNIQERGQLRIPAGPSAILRDSGGSLHTGQTTVGVEP